MSVFNMGPPRSGLAFGLQAVTGIPRSRSRSSQQTGHRWIRRNARELTISTPLQLDYVQIWHTRGGSPLYKRAFVEVSERAGLRHTEFRFRTRVCGQVRYQPWAERLTDKKSTRSGAPPWLCRRRFDQHVQLESTNQRWCGDADYSVAAIEIVLLRRLLVSCDS